MIKEDLIIAVLVTFCLTSALFIIMPTRSSEGTTEFEYDPWLDLNDDGAIDIYDVTWICQLYDAKGIPINKTELLYEVNATYTRLLSRIDSLNVSLLDLKAYLLTRIITLETSLVALEDKVENLENSLLEQQAKISKLVTLIDILNATKLGNPDYDSEWTDIALNDFHIFNHNLGTTNVIVYLMGYDVSSGVIHQTWYGGEINGNWWAGVCWQELTTTTIKVFRHANDDSAAFSWDYTRVLIWKIP